MRWQERLSEIRERYTPNYRVLPPNVSMFFVGTECCAHCAHGGNIGRRVYCYKVYKPSYKAGIQRSRGAVKWHGVCDAFSHKRKDQRT